MMTEKNAVTLLTQTNAAKIYVWVDGGWGVDALIGHQTRDHNDIDLFVQKQHEASFRALVTSLGFTETKVEFSTKDHTVWRNAEGGIIDLHVFRHLDADTLEFEGEHYPMQIFSGQGKIGSFPVRCLTAEAQLLYHQGYEHDKDDIHDVMLLCETFGLSVPPEYQADR